MSRILSFIVTKVYEIDYIELLRDTKSLSLLWLGTFASSLGDWCRHVSIIALVIRLTGAGIEMAFVLVLEIFPLIFVGPILLGFIDKYNPRNIMIIIDIMRAILVLWLLTVNSINDIWLIYLITVAISMLDIYYQANHIKLIANIVPSNKLIQANSLFALTSGITLAGGTFLSSFVLSTYGATTAFLFDASTFIFAGLLLCGINHLQRLSLSFPHDCRNFLYNCCYDLKDLVEYLKNNYQIYNLLFLNVFRFIGSGSTYILLGVFGTTIFKAGDFGVSAYYACFGIGIFLGGFIAHKIAKKFSNINHYFLIGLAALLEGILIIIFSQTKTMLLSLFIIVGAYISRAIFITIYDSLMMKNVNDIFLGRVLMIDKILSYTVMSLTMLICAWGLKVINPRHIALLTGAYLFLNGAQWLIRKRKELFKNTYI